MEQLRQSQQQLAMAQRMLQQDPDNKELLALVEELTEVIALLRETTKVSELSNSLTS